MVISFFNYIAATLDRYTYSYTYIHIHNGYK